MGGRGIPASGAGNVQRGRWGSAQRGQQSPSSRGSSRGSQTNTLETSLNDLAQLLSSNPSIEEVCQHLDAQYPELKKDTYFSTGRFYYSGEFYSKSNILVDITVESYFGKTDIEITTCVLQISQGHKQTGEIEKILDSLAKFLNSNPSISEACKYLEVQSPALKKDNFSYPGEYLYSGKFYKDCYIPVNVTVKSSSGKTDIKITTRISKIEQRN